MLALHVAVSRDCCYVDSRHQLSLSGGLSQSSNTKYTTVLILYN